MSETIDSLSSMFPQIDRDIIIAIFDENKGNVEACIPQLLEISDPTSQQANPQTPSGNNTAQSNVSNEEQIKKDEELARKLAQDLSDEEFARQLQEEEARNRQMEIERERQERERMNGDNGVQIKEKLTAGIETIKQKSREIYERFTNKVNEQRSMNRNQYSNLPDNNDDSVLLGNSYEQPQSQNHYTLNGSLDEEESLDRRNPNFTRN